MTEGPADALVWFGATGDLAYKKTFPSLYAMAKRGELKVPIIGVARSGWNLEKLRARGKESITEHGGIDDTQALESLIGALHYVDGDYGDQATFDALRGQLDNVGAKAPANYLAIPPSMFETVTSHLGNSGCADNARVIVEKPFGRDLESAQDLNRVLHMVFSEDAIYRIDHYLGKEEVMNLLYVRFANSVFEPIWNRNYVRCVQVTMGESFGVQGRGKFYEEAGTVRDVVQNHMLQIVSMLAMEPPAGKGFRALRDAKEAVLSAMDPISPDHIVRGQFEGYRDEPGVAPDSDVETFAAVRLHIDSWRWHSVPWFVRAGKKLADTTTEVVVEFSQPPTDVFEGQMKRSEKRNYIRFRLNPDPMIGLGVRALVPDDQVHGKCVELTLSDDVVDEREPYERLFSEALAGHNTLFVSQRGTEAAWKVVNPILENHPAAIPYAPGTWGPKEAEKMVQPFGGWRDLSVNISC